MWLSFALVHLTTAAVWLGGMSYSLLVVQPKAARFFAGDELRREEFLTTLAQGNRWKVVGLIGALAVTGLGVVLTAGRVTALGYGVVLVLYAAAAAIFANVSWRHWPARVFALPQELPAFRHSLTRQAWAMLGLVGAAFLVALSVSLTHSGSH
jgi:Flp pilus assembly protein TadB